MTSATTAWGCDIVRPLVQPRKSKSLSTSTSLDSFSFGKKKRHVKATKELQESLCVAPDSLASGDVIVAMCYTNYQFQLVWLVSPPPDLKTFQFIQEKRESQKFTFIFLLLSLYFSTEPPTKSFDVPKSYIEEALAFVHYGLIIAFLILLAPPLLLLPSCS